MQTVQQLQILTSIRKPEDITSMSLVNEFSDDSIACATAKINDVDVDLFWCGGKVVGALECDDSIKAKQMVVDAIEAECASTVCGLMDMIDEELKENIIKYREQYDVVFEYCRNLPPESDTAKEMAAYLAECEILDSNWKLIE